MSAKVEVLINNQKEKIRSIETNLYSEQVQLRELENLNNRIIEYKEIQTNRSFWVWCVDVGYSLDFPDDIIELINKIEI